MAETKEQQLSRPQLVDRVAYLIEACRGRRVVHLGCANAPYTEVSIAEDSLLHARLGEVAGELWGVDSDRQGLALLEAHGHERLVEADLESLDGADLPRRPDVIVAGEIIEHLSNPGRFLHAVKPLMGPATTLLLTTVNAYCGMRFVIYALRGRGGRAEPVHPDHVAYYSYSTLHLLLERHGLEVTSFAFYDLGPEHRPHNRFYLNWINDIMVRASRQLADGIVVECRLA